MVDEIIALNTKLSQQFDFADEEFLIAKIKRLAPPDANTLLERCLASQTADSFYLLALHYTFCVKPPNARQEVEALQKAVALGDSRACHLLAYNYQIGHGIPKDDEMAWDLYKRSGHTHSLWNLAMHHQKTDPETALRYFARAWALYPPGIHREDCRTKIQNMMADDANFQWVINLARQDELHKNRIVELEAQVEALRTELDYRPGGFGYQEAQQDFETRAQSLDPV